MAKKGQEPGLVRASDALPQPLAEVPDHLIDVSSKAGFENVEAKDQLIPRLALCQSMTPQRKSTNANFIPELKEGDFFHSIKGTVYGPGPLVITPIFMFKSGLNMDDDGNMICRSDDGKNCPKYGQCKSDDWESGEDGKNVPPPCSKLYNFPVVIYGDEITDFAILTLKSTSVKIMKQWIAKMKSVRNPHNGEPVPMYATAWKIASVADKKDKYEFFNVKFDGAGWTPGEVYREAERMYEDLKKQYAQGKLKVDVTGLDDEDTPPPTSREDSEM
jgi:hypothetical protein